MRLSLIATFGSLVLAACAAPTGSSADTPDESDLTGGKEAPAVALSALPSGTTLHTIEMRSQPTALGNDAFLDTCQFYENGEVPRHSAPGDNEILPTKSSSLVFTNTSNEDMLVQVFTRDATSLNDNFPKFITPSFDDVDRFPSENFGYDFSAVIAVAPGASIAANVPAHGTPRGPREVSVELRCQPRGVFEVRAVGRFHYGGTLTYDIR